jgi:multiple sugar transport system permease protein/putative chitobiose transport system permease protein
MEHRESAKRFTFSQIWIYLALALITIIILLPLEWIIASSFTDRETVFKNVLPFSLKALWPTNPTLAAYRAIFEDDFGRAILNTLGVAITTVIGCLVVGTTAGFAFARFDFRLKGLLWTLVLLSLMVPYEATVIPSYSMINDLGWTNSWQALIVPGLANGTVIFLFRQFFSEIPQDFLDAARLDGANWPRVMTTVVLPLSVPVIVTASVLVFIAQWNSFFWPMLVAPDPNYRVVQVAVSMIGVRQQLTYWDMLFAASTIAAVVPLLLVLPLQRFYINSIMGSGVKG